MREIAAKHRPGLHDQSSHGRRRGSRATFRALTPEQAQAMQDKMLAEKPWTGAQRQALVDYTGNEYKPMNARLRGLSTADPSFDVGTQNRIRDANAAMRPLPEPVKVFRNVGPKRLGFPTFIDARDNLDSLVGKTLQDPGFMSTSILNEGLDDFGQVHMTIDVPAGIGAAYVESLTQNEHENELILAPGTRLKILRVDSEPRPMVIEAQVVP